MKLFAFPDCYYIQKYFGNIPRKEGLRLSEEELIASLHKGETAALEELIRRYIRYVSSIVGRIVRGSAEDCEELTYDVFTAAWENRSILQEGKLKSWLGTVARNKAFNLLKTRHESLPLEEDIIVLDRTEESENVDTALLIEKALSQLETKQRELFVRHYYYGQTLCEAAKEMELNLSTAKTWLCRGREKLKDILEKEGYTV